MSVTMQLLMRAVVDLQGRVDRLEADRQSTVAPTPTDAADRTGQDQRRKQRNPPPRVLSREIQWRRGFWDALVLRGGMAGEVITKGGFAFRYHLSEREFRRWFTETGRQVPINSTEDKRIRARMKEERTRIEKKLAELKRRPAE